MKVIAISERTLSLLKAAARYWQQKDCAYYLWYEHCTKENWPDGADIDLEPICDGSVFEEHQTVTLMLVFSAYLTREITKEKAIEFSGLSEEKFMKMYGEWLAVKDTTVFDK